MGIITLQLKPAYGRKIKGRKDALELWNDNKDFVIQTMGMHGVKINKADFQKFAPDDNHLKGVRYINVRYNNDADVAVFNVNQNYEVVDG